MWLENIDRHQKGKTIWKKSSERNVSRTDNIVGHWFLDQLTGIPGKILELLPGVWWSVNIILLSCRSWFSARCSDASVHLITTRMAFQQVYWNQRQAAGSWTGGFIYAICEWYAHFFFKRVSCICRNQVFLSQFERFLYFWSVVCWTIAYFVSYNGMISGRLSGDSVHQSTVNWPMVHAL